MYIKDVCVLPLTFILILICHVTAKEIFSTNQDEDSTGINDLDLIADGRLKRTSYNSLNDIEDQNSFLSSLQYRPDGSLFPRQLRQSPYFALRGKRIPGDDYASTDDKSIFSGDLSDNFPSNTLQSRDKRMISMFTYPVPRYEAMIRRILGQTMKMSDEKAKDLSMDKRQHYRFHALRGK